MGYWWRTLSFDTDLADVESYADRYARNLLIASLDLPSAHAFGDASLLKTRLTRLRSRYKLS